MKRLILLVTYVICIVSPVHAAENCYLEIEKAGNYNPEVISGFVTPLINKYFIQIKQIPSFGIKESDCRYSLQISENKEKTTISISGKSLNLISESTLSGMNGVQQAALKAMLADKVSIKEKLCISFPNLIPIECGLDLVSNPSEEEKEIWEIIKDTIEPEDMIDFIQTYPNGRYRYLANLKLMWMGKPAIEIDKAKNGSAVQEKELWDQIKPRQKIEELKYFLTEFPNGSKRRVARLLLRKLERDEKKEAAEYKRWTTQLDSPRFDGVYYRTGHTKHPNTREEVSCTTYYRFFPHKIVLTWFNTDLSCDERRKPDDKWLLSKVSEHLCLLPGCREKRDFDDVQLQFIISMTEYRWMINEDNMLVILRSYQPMVNGEYKKEVVAEDIMGPVFTTGVRMVKDDPRLAYNDPKKWPLLFIPYDGLRNVSGACNPDIFIAEGNKELENAAAIDNRYKRDRVVDKALLWFQSAVSCNDKVIDTHYALAKGYESKRDVKRAAESYLKALELDPDNTKAITKAVSYHLKRRANKRALEDIRAFYENSSKRDLPLMEVYSQALFSNCECEDAVASIEEAEAKGSQNALLDHYRGVCQLRLGNAAEGMSSLKARSEKDGFEYTRSALTNFMRFHPSVSKDTSFKSWLGSLPKGSRDQQFERISCFKR